MTSNYSLTVQVLVEIQQMTSRAFLLTHHPLTASRSTRRHQAESTGYVEFSAVQDIKITTYLALEQLKTSTTASADVTELVLRAVVRDNGRGITTTNNDGSTLLCGLDSGIKESL